MVNKDSPVSTRLPAGGGGGGPPGLLLSSGTEEIGNHWRKPSCQQSPGVTSRVRPLAGEDETIDFVPWRP